MHRVMRTPAVVTSHTQLLTRYLRAAALLCAPSILGAQTVVGRVLAPESGAPLHGVLVSLIDSAGVRVAAGFADEQGRFTLGISPGGPYTVRAEIVGRVTVNSTPFTLSGGESRTIELTGGRRAAVLDDIEIIARDECRPRPAVGEATAAVWEETTKALRATSVAQQSRMYKFEVETYHRQRRPNGSGRGGYTHRVTVFESQPFSARTPDELSRDGYVATEGNEVVYHAPDHAALLSDAFMEQHCFWIEDGGRGRAGLIGLAFEPVVTRTKPDVRGVFLIDRKTGELRRLEFAYTGIPEADAIRDGGGRLEFQRLPSGAWIVSKWSIRMPILVASASEENTGEPRKRPRVGAIYERGGTVKKISPAPAGSPLPP